MKKRDLEPILHVSLRRFPVVALFGLRQLGKTLLARAVARSFDGAIYLHLTRPGYRRTLSGAARKAAGYPRPDAAPT